MICNAVIVKELEDESYKGILCEVDGDIKNTGKLLNKYYKSVQKINTLINLGALKLLGRNFKDTKLSNRKRKFLKWRNPYDLITAFKYNPCHEYLYVYTHGEWYFMNKENELLKLNKEVLK